jgi:CHAD domain-containing protein
MGPSRALEREVKFEASMEFELPDLRPLVGRTERLPEQHLDTVYYDTAEGRLWAQGITLRHRTTRSGDPGVWTVKLPVADDGPSLDRTELTWSGGRDEVPSAAIDLLRGVTRRAPLRPLVTLHSVRRRLVLHGDHGEVAELDDDTVVVEGGSRDGLSFRQVELELRPGGDAVRDAVVAELERAGAQAGDYPKLAKALAFPAADDTGPILDRTASIGDVVQAAIADALRRLLGHDWRLRASLPDVEAHDVHQARVATRRLRSHLKTFGGVLDQRWVTHARDDLGWLGSVLGEVRDADVLGGHLERAPAELRGTLADQRRAAVEQLAGALASDRYLDLLDRLHAASGVLPRSAGGGPLDVGTPAAGALASLVGDQFRSVRRKVRKAGDHPSDRQLHRIRIKAKQLRYAAELATPVVGRPAGRTASAAEELQTVLGEHHDAVTAAAWLRARAERSGHRMAAGRASPVTLFEAGRLSADEERRQRKLRRRWPAAWERLAKPKRRRWLR